MSLPTVKSKIKVKKPPSESDSEDGSDHELFFYANDRVQLMKEVLKLLKPKKIKAIAPDFMKNLDIEEINSMLLEELLGISNKRLKNILNGVNVDESSSESEDEKQPIDVISLDDISDIEDFNSEGNLSVVENQKNKKNKQVNIKSEHVDEKEKLMSVLEILELQARARAIRSQLALENEQKGSAKKPVESGDSDIEEIVLQTTKNEEVVVIDSENEVEREGVDVNPKGEPTIVQQNKNQETMNQNIPEEKSTKEVNDSTNSNESNKISSCNELSEDKNIKGNKIDVEEGKQENIDKVRVETNYGDDTIVINLDTVEIEEMEK